MDGSRQKDKSRVFCEASVTWKKCRLPLQIRQVSPHYAQKLLKLHILWRIAHQFYPKDFRLLEVCAGLGFVLEMVTIKFS